MSSEGKHMDKVMKIVLMAVGAGTVTVAVTVIGLMGMKKDADVSKVASSGQVIEMQENQSEKTSISKEKLKSEASELYGVHKEELICSLEELDGITIAVAKTEILTGFMNCMERCSAFDPVLTPQCDGKGDMFTEYFSCAFKMNDYSTAYDVKNKIGHFKGKTVYMKDMDMLYYTRDFYTTNFNVQD